jgi:DNA-binding transcriptional ArsR family regulator
MAKAATSAARRPRKIARPSSGEGDVCEVKYVNEKQVRLVQAQLIEDEAAHRLAETFKVLSDPTRVKILHALSLAELCVCDLSNLLGMNDSAVSHHLRLLRALKLVKYRKEGRTVYYSLDDEHIEKLFQQGLEHVQEAE